MKRKISIILTLVMLIAGGCSSKSDVVSNDKQTDKVSTQNEVNKKVKVAMVADTGGVNDQAVNQACWEGLKLAQLEIDSIEAGYVESKQEADYGANLERLYEAGNDMIWGIGYTMADAIAEAADKNPEQTYGIIDFNYEEIKENVIAVVFKEQEVCYLAGYIAGKMTESNTVGFVGGMKGVLIDRFEYGFRAGVKKANPDAEIQVQYADSWGDVAKGKAIANQMFQKGVDVIFHAAGGTGLGVIESAKENDKYAIGTDKDQNYLAPDHVLTSTVKNMNVAMFSTVEELAEGTLTAGKNKVLGLKEGGVGLAESTDKNVPKDILAEVENVKEEVINGNITVPYNEATFADYMTNLK